MEYLELLRKIPTQKGKPHKPLLILLCLTHILRGHVNKFTYKEIEKDLDFLIKKFTPGNGQSGNPQYPFVFLQSSPEIWECSIKKDELKNPDAPSKKEMENVVGNFSEGFIQAICNDQKGPVLLKNIILLYFDEKLAFSIFYELLKK